jgi:hypothetical protein
MIKDLYSDYECSGELLYPGNLDIHIPECGKFNWTIPSEIELKDGQIDCSDNTKAEIIKEKYGDQYCVSNKKGVYTGKQVEYVCSKTGKKYCSDKLCFS